MPSTVSEPNLSRTQLEHILDKSNIPANGATLQSDLRTGLIDVLGTSCELLPRNHASIALPLFVAANGTFDFGKLQKVTGDVVINLNRILDAALARSQTIDRNKDYRIIAVGAHGLADAFAALRLPYDSPEAASLNSRIAETMYYAALKTSCDLAETHGAYAAFQDSPLARGKFQFDLWGATPSKYFDWDTLRRRIRNTGVANAAIIAMAPGSCLETATGYTDSTDPALR
jgi:ribonucleotide reductase alpha subunit